MVGRALDREIDRDLQPVLVRLLHQPPEVLERAELRMQRIVAAIVRADRVDGAEIAGAPAVSELFLPLRLVFPIGWIGGK